MKTIAVTIAKAITGIINRKVIICHKLNAFVEHLWG
jgi:hypothetical protein